MITAIAFMVIGSLLILFSLIYDNREGRLVFVLLGLLLVIPGGVGVGYHEPEVTTEPLVPTIDTTYTTDGVTIDTVLTYTYKR